MMATESSNNDTIIKNVDDPSNDLILLFFDVNDFGTIDFLHLDDLFKQDFRFK